MRCDIPLLLAKVAGVYQRKKHTDAANKTEDALKSKLRAQESQCYSRDMEDETASRSLGVWQTCICELWEPAK